MRENLKEAARWFRLAAEQGDAMAQVMLDRLSSSQHKKGETNDGGSND